MTKQNRSLGLLKRSVFWASKYSEIFSQIVQMSENQLNHEYMWISIIFTYMYHKKIREVTPYFSVRLSRFQRVSEVVSEFHSILVNYWGFQIVSVSFSELQRISMVQWFLDCLRGFQRISLNFIDIGGFSESFSQFRKFY